MVDRVKESEAQGYTYDAADASFALMLHEEVGGERPRYFQMESWRASVHFTEAIGGDGECEATVKLRAGGSRVVRTGEGNGPVNALDHALREALVGVYPEIEQFELTDFRVRLLDTSHGTDAVTRVLIQTSSGAETWSTVGVGPNILEAAYEALVDSLVYGLLQAGVDPR